MCVDSVFQDVNADGGLFHLSVRPRTRTGGVHGLTPMLVIRAATPRYPFGSKEKTGRSHSSPALKARVFAI